MRHRALQGRLNARRGFSYIEAAVAMMIISTGVVALCGLFGAGTNATAGGNELTTAVHLANSLHEAAAALPSATNDAEVIGHPHDVWSLNGVTYSPVVDGSWQPIADMAGWSQQVVVKPADEDDGAAAGEASASHLVRMTVTVCHNGHDVYTQSWLLTAATQAQ